MTQPAPSEIERQIAATHRRFVKAMDGRIAEMDADRRDRYFAVLSMLVGKLEAPDKSLREIMQEMMSEAMTFVLQEMQGS